MEDNPVGLEQRWGGSIDNGGALHYDAIVEFQANRHYRCSMALELK